jgi:hypothetical protein
MIGEKKTVFVLGAGASVPYGYPSGRDLKNEVIKLRDDSNLWSAFDLTDDFDRFDDVVSNIPLSEVNHLTRDNPFFYLADSLNKSGKFTIDEFLRTNTHLLEIGKFSIAHVLIRNEVEGSLIRDEWCQLLWNRISKGKSDPYEVRPNIAFVTFNYDTSLEYIFSQAILNTFPNARQEHVDSFFSAVPILHIHGKIRPLPWEGGDKGGIDKIRLRRFTNDEILEMSKGINLFHEADNEKIIDESQRLLSKAKNVVFLGFGFDVANVSKLNVRMRRPTPLENFTNADPLRFKGGIVMRIREVQEDIFKNSSLFATGIGLNEKQRMDVRGIAGLGGLQFVDYKSIFEYLDAHIDELL